MNQIMNRAIKHIHFVGVGGSGMSGIAEVLHQLGYQVSGSDLADSDTLHRLGAAGIKTYLGHDSSHVAGADVVVTSSALQTDNPEVAQARHQNIPVVQRAVMLAELMRFKAGIAIAGTHGKTTTTSLVTSVLLEAGLDPSFVMGGTLNSAAANARLGQGDAIVVEADESDASFLKLLPMMAVVTNIDADHMVTYGHDLQALKSAFVEFLHRMPFYGTAIVCSDDPGLSSILPQVQRPLLRYGVGDDAQVRAVGVVAHGSQMHFSAQRPGRTDLAVVLNLPGIHNVLNALAAIAVATLMGAPDSAVQAALAKFQGVGRRFQRYGDLPVQGDGTGAAAFTLIDDYGHHPVEMAATLAAARGAFVGRRLVLAFQPHRYSRTRDCFADFVRVLGHADAVLLTEVYGAGEPPLPGADGAALASAVTAGGQTPVQFVGAIGELAQAIVSSARAGDVVLCMGAGSIGEVSSQIVRLLQKTEQTIEKGRGL